MILGRLFKKEGFAFIMATQLGVAMSPHVPPVPPVLHFLGNEDENFLNTRSLWFSNQNSCHIFKILKSTGFFTTFHSFVTPSDCPVIFCFSAAH